MSIVASNARVTPVERQAADLLELFYPIHYRGNMAVEDAMRGDLTRKQAAIIWLIRSAGSDNGRSMRRKEIVARLQDWFDVTSPAVTQALRQMATPPFSLVRLVEDANSGREKRVILTAKGERFLAAMVERGCNYLCKLVVRLREDQVDEGVEFLRAAIAAYEQVHAEDPDVSRPSKKVKPRRPARNRQQARPHDQDGYANAE
ncbi:MAG TPA: winged helix DNA-binding protein [Candidatus Binataceae bacterium]|nr:winged helix DNA-binding protein [Candidatus Binataceae bacterium]